MMRIAICDDDIRDIEHLRKCIHAHSDKHEVIEYTSAKVFLERFYSGECFDLLFLDVQMPDSNGWEIAKELKQARHKIYIAMVTVCGEYIFDCFDRVDWFAPKPILPEKVCQILDSANERLFPKVFEFETNHMNIILTAPEIIYLEIQRNTLIVNSIRGCYEVRLSLKKAKEILAGSKQFVQTHNSYIINLDYYDGLKGTYIRLKNRADIKLSRTYRSSFFQALAEYIKGV